MAQMSLASKIKTGAIGLGVAAAFLVGVHYLPRLVDLLNSLPGWLVFVVVGFLVFAEAAIFVGFIFPGETAVILAGVIAGQGHLNVVAVMATVVICAIAGDSVGYFVGERYGDRVLSLKLIERRRAAIDGAIALIRRRGPWAVFLGRFTAFLRAVMPGLAGLSKMPYRTFLWANALGGLVWGVGFVLLGYLAGSAYKRIEHYASWASYALLAVAVVVIFFIHRRNKAKERAIEAAYEQDLPTVTVHRPDTGTPPSR